MSFQIDLDDFERAYAHFAREVREAIQRTFQEESANGLTQKEMARILEIDESLVSRRLNGPGNITLRTLSDIFAAMGREPLSNFEAPATPLDSPVTTTSKLWLQLMSGPEARSVTGASNKFGYAYA